MAEISEERVALSDALAVLGSSIGIVLGAILAFGSPDPAMAFHGALLGLAGVLGMGYVLTDAFGTGPSKVPQSGYFDGPIKVATIAAVFWGIAGFAIGDILAWQMAFPWLNLDLPWTSFGRLRPLHTSAVIFAFGGNVLIGTSFYVVQRTCQARLAGRWSPYFVVWGYQLFILLAGTGYVLGVETVEAMHPF